MPRKQSNNDERYRPPNGLKELIDDLFTRALKHDADLLPSRRGYTEKQLRQTLQRLVRIPNTDISPWSKGNKDDARRITNRLLALFSGGMEYIDIKGSELEKDEARTARDTARRVTEILRTKETSDVELVCGLLVKHLREVQNAKIEDEREKLLLQKAELHSKAREAHLEREAQTEMPSPSSDRSAALRHIVHRQKLFGQTWKLITDPDNVMIARGSFALVGGGGYGKSTLATSIYRAAKASGVFDHVIQTGDIGKKTDDAISAAHLIGQELELNSASSVPATPEAAAELLSRATYDKHALIIVDNIWTEAQHRIFLNCGPDCVLLVTTRVRSAVSGNATIIDVGPMTKGEATTVLSHGLPVEVSERAQIRDLARVLHYWPQLLAMANRVVAQRCERGSPLGQALRDYHNKLLRRGITGIDPINETERGRAVNICFDESIEELTPSQLESFMDLGAFLRSTEIPMGIIEKLWGDVDADDFLQYLSDGLALVERVDFRTRVFSLHDNVAAYLEQRAGPSKLVDSHRRILKVFSEISSGDYALLPISERYAWAATVYHLDRSGQIEQADSLRLQYSWIRGLLQSCDVAALNECYACQSSSSAVLEIGEALKYSRFALARSPEDLPRQIFGRLSPSQNDEVKQLVREATEDPHLQPVPTFPHLLNLSHNYQTAPGHSATVRSAKFSPDGTTIATASWDGTTIVWEVATGLPKRVLVGHTGQVQSTAWSPSGMQLATGGGAGDQSVRIWDPQSGDLTRVLGMHDERVRWVSYNLSDQEVISVSHDKKVIIWPVEGDDPRILSGWHASAILTVDVSQQSALAVTASQDELLRVFDLVQEKLVCQLKAHNGWLRTAFWHPYLNVIVSASDDYSVAIWQLEEKRLHRLSEITGFKNGARSARFSPDGKKIVIACGRGAHLYDVEDLSDPKKLLEVSGHTAEVLGADFSECGKLLVTFSHDHTARIFDVSNGARRAVLGHNNRRVRSVCLSSNCQYYVAVYDDDTLEVRDARSGRSVYSESATVVQSVAFANTSNDIICASRDGSLSRLTWGTFEKQYLLKVHSDLIHSIAISEDDKYLVTASDDNRSVVVSLAEQARIVRVNEIHRATVKCVCSDERMSSIFSGSDDRTASAWTRQHWRSPKTVIETDGAVLACSSKRDGSAVAFGSSDMVTYVASQPGATMKLTHHTGAVTAVAYFENDRFLVTGSQDKTVRILDGEDFRCLSTIELDASVSALSCRGGTICIGDNLGSVHLFVLTGNFSNAVAKRET